MGHKVTVETVNTAGAHECERLFGRDRGAAVQELVERALQRPCPCKVGNPCPLAKR